MVRRKRAKPVVKSRSPAEVAALVTDNMKLAHYFVGKYERWFPDHQALLSSAMEGLWRAAEHWDGRVPFGSYASLRIRWLMGRTVKPPTAVKRGRDVKFIHIDEPGENGHDLHSAIKDMAATEPDGHSDEFEMVRTTITKLPDVERRVLELRFGFGNGGYEHTLEETGRKMGFTRERARQVEQQALARAMCVHLGLPFDWDASAHRMRTPAGRTPVSASAARQKKLRKCG